MREWKENLPINIVCNLSNENYISISKIVNETALRVLLKEDGYETFIVMGNHKETIDNIETELDIFEWFYQNTNGTWSSNLKILRDYIDQLPTNINIQSNS